MNKSYDAYFTVEAALVLPMVMSAVLMGVYLFCFQYDRCLLEQDMGSLIVWCSREALENAGETKELEQKIQTRTGEIYRDKYVAWELTAINVELEQNDISVSGAGQLTFPVPGWNLWNDSNLWETDTRYECQRLSPVFYIRQFRKLGDLLQKGDEESGAP